MGKIFGISDLPASTIMTPFEPYIFKGPAEVESLQKQSKNFKNKTDAFVSKTSKPKLNPFIKMRNGFGRLMKSFSGKI